MATKTNETTRKIIQYLFDEGVYAWRQSTGGIFDGKRNIYRPAAKVGVADILGIVGPAGRLLACEVKTGRDRLRDEQEGFLTNIARLGGVALIVKDFEDFKQQWKQLE